MLKLDERKIYSSLPNNRPGTIVNMGKKYPPKNCLLGPGRFWIFLRCFQNSHKLFLIYGKNWYSEAIFDEKGQVKQYAYH